MPLPYVLDEDSRHRALWHAIQEFNRRHPDHLIDAVRVGDNDGPNSGTLDPELIEWACNEQRIIVSCDKSTLITHHAEYIQAGNTTPGLMVIQPNSLHADVAEFLGLYSACRDGSHSESSTLWIPDDL